MTISTIKHCAIFLIMFICCANIAHAELEITEIMYDPQGSNDSHQWIEVYNNNSSPIDLLNCAITDYDTSWHYRSIVSEGTSVLAPYSYAIIAKTSDLQDFKIKNSTLPNIFLRANITLLSSNGKLGISLDKKSIANGSDVSYFSVMDDGNSLQKINNDWVPSIPTPGKENVLNTNNDTSSNTNNENSSPTSTSGASASSDSSTPKEVPIILKISTKIISPKTVIAGIPFSINSLTTTNRGQTYLTGKFVWNFGDGKMSEARQGLPFEYTYEYPGEYALNLTYFESYLSESSSASDRIIIKVVPSEVYINGVGDILDPFVEIGNKSSNEIFLSNWVITAGIHYFIIPEGTTLLPGKKIKLSPKITGFTGEDIRYVVITNPNNIISATYPNIIVKKVVQKSSSINENNTSTVEKVTQDNLPDNNSQIINLNELGASAGDSGIKVSKLAYSIIGLFVIIGLGIMSFVLIKKKTQVKDYLEKEIRAEDMTIIE